MGELTQSGTTESGLTASDSAGNRNARRMTNQVFGLVLMTATGLLMLVAATHLEQAFRSLG